MSNFLNDLPGELFDEEPICGYCADTGTVYPDFIDQDNPGEMEFCECERGSATAQAHLDGKCYDDHDEDWDDSGCDSDWSSGDEMDYERGRMQGERYSMERKIYGSALADEFAFQDELNDYNWGL